MNGYLVSLPEHQAERWPRLEAKIASFGLTPVLVDGVRAKKLIKGCVNLGEVGCLLAHKGIMEDVISTGEPAYIFEDDVQFRKGLKELPTELFLKHKMGLLGSGQDNWKNLQRKKGYYWAERTSYGTFAYFVAPAMAEIILKKIKRNPTAIDRIFCRSIYSKFNVPVMLPFMAIAWGRRSNIQPAAKERSRPIKSRWRLNEYE